MPVLTALGRWRQENLFNDILGCLGNWSSAWDMWDLVTKGGGERGAGGGGGKRKAENRHAQSHVAPDTPL